MIIRDCVRKKKCDGRIPSCQNCHRLGLLCAGYQTEIIWEDDQRREGMRKRGQRARIQTIKNHLASATARGRNYLGTNAQEAPSRESVDFVTSDQNRSYSSLWSSNEPPHSDCFESDAVDENFDMSCIQTHHPLSEALPINPRRLTSKQALLFDRYIHRFSRIYPSCQHPSNPFLSVLLPMALSNDTVFTALLALSGAQTWGAEWEELQQETLRARHHTIQTCRKLLSDVCEGGISGLRVLESAANTDLLCLIACVTILLIYEKLSGENYQNWKPHLDFVGHVFNNAERIFSQSCRSSEAFQFLLHMFVYNDLVGSTSLRTTTLSKLYVEAVQASESVIFSGRGVYSSRYYYPSLISRISSGDQSVTLSDISNWDGQLYWFPSHCLEKTEEIPSPPDNGILPSSDYVITAEIYRAAAVIHHQHMLGKTSSSSPSSTGSQPCLPLLDHQEDNDPFYYHRHAVQLMDLLPEASPVENVLLWPISIFAPDLTSEHVAERESVIRRLEGLEKRFQMRHFRRAREILQEGWNAMDWGLDPLPIMESSILQG